MPLSPRRKNRAETSIKSPSDRDKIVVRLAAVPVPKAEVSGRRLRPRRIRLAPPKTSWQSPPVEQAEVTDLKVVPVETIPTATPPVPQDMQAWYDEAAKYADAEQRMTVRMAKMRRGILFVVGVAAAASVLTYFRLSLRQPPPLTAAEAMTKALTTHDPTIAADLNAYVNKELPRIQSDEVTALQTYSKVTGKNFHGLNAVTTALNTTIVPNYSRFVTEAQSINPKTQPVKVLHTMFVHSAEAKLQAFRHMQEGERKPNGRWQVDARMQTITATVLSNNFKKQLVQLAKAQKVKLP